MSSKFGWFDVPLGGDPAKYSYSAHQMRDLWRSLLTNGIVPEIRKAQSNTIIPFKQLGSSLSATAGKGLNVLISAGVAWVDGAYFVVEQEPEAVTLQKGWTNDVVLRLDMTGLDVVFGIFNKQRSASSIEAGLTRGGGVYEIGLHSVTIPADCTQITQSMIIDQRLNMNEGVDGLPCCGLVASMLQPDIDAWYKNADAQQKQWYEEAKKIVDDLVAGVVPDGSISYAKLNGDMKSSITHSLTHSRSGTVHTLTGVVPTSGLVTVRFKAVTNFVENDGFRIGTASGGYITYTAKPTGEETKLPDKAFVTNDIVTAEVDIGAKKINFKIGGSGGLPKDWQDIRTAEAGENIAKGDAIAMTKQASIDSGELAYADVITTDSLQSGGGFYGRSRNRIKVSNDGVFLICVTNMYTLEIRKLQNGKYVDLPLHSSIVNIVDYASGGHDISFDSRTLVIIPRGNIRTPIIYVVDLYNPSATPKQLNFTMEGTGLVCTGVTGITCYNTRRMVEVTTSTSFPGSRTLVFDLDTLQTVPSDPFFNKALAVSGNSVDVISIAPDDSSIYYTTNTKSIVKLMASGTQNLLTVSETTVPIVSPTGKLITVSDNILQETGTEFIKLPNPAVPITGYFNAFTKDEKYLITMDLNVYKISGTTFTKLPKSTTVGKGALGLTCSENYCFALGNSRIPVNSTETKTIASFSLNTKALINKLTSDNASLVVSKKVNGGFGISEQAATKGQQCKVNLFKKQNQALGQTI